MMEERPHCILAIGKAFLICHGLNQIYELPDTLLLNKIDAHKYLQVDGFAGSVVCITTSMLMFFVNSSYQLW